MERDRYSGYIRIMDSPGTDGVGKLPHLTPKEVEVIVVLCSLKYLREKDMYTALHMALGTFKSHKQDVFMKFKVKSRLQVVYKAMQWGLVPCGCGHGATAVVVQVVLDPNSGAANSEPDGAPGILPPDGPDTAKA